MDGLHAFISVCIFDISCQLLSMASISIRCIQCQVPKNDGVSAGLLQHAFVLSI